MDSNQSQHQPVLACNGFMSTAVNVPTEANVFKALHAIAESSTQWQTR